MKTLLYILIGLFLGSCASVSPVGNWDYKVTGTPEGDYSGVMTVVKKEKKMLNAVMKSGSGEFPFSRFTYNSKSKKSSGDFTYQGMGVVFDAAVSENEMNGNISVEGMTFPFKGTRKK